jgi:hypothetical protein
MAAVHFGESGWRCKVSNKPHIVTPTDKSLPNQEDRALALQIQKLQEVDHLPELRKQAEQYRNALLALTTLVSAAWVVGGVTKATDLTPDRRLMVGWLLVAAFTLLVAGSVISIRAAYGGLRRPTVVTTDLLRIEKHKEYRETHRAIRISRYAIVIAVILLGFAIGTAFFNPKPLDAPLVKAVLRTATICGTLSGEDSSHIRIETISDSGEKVTRSFSYSDLKALRPVTQCP